MLKPNFSQADTLVKEKEEACYIHFMDFLDECQGMLCECLSLSVMMSVVFTVDIRLRLYLTDSMAESLDDSTVTLKDVLIFTGADRV